MKGLRCVPVAPEHAPGLRAMLGEVSNGCYCRWWHYDGEDHDWTARCNLEPERNAEAMAEALRTKSPTGSGVVALVGDRVVGWLKLAPATAMTKLYGRRVYRALSCFDGERDGVLVVGCMAVAPDLRRRGVAGALLEAAIGWAREQGATSLEATPRRAAHAVRDDELWMGPPSIFDEAGFVRVDDGPEAYPVMRLVLEPR
ncbi:MAG TPA: N-acetyltransferase [Polyangiaceae bacterium]|nr:N-acetyltransferase [Polyangiaceae bacterium]